MQNKHRSTSPPHSPYVTIMMFMYQKLEVRNLSRTDHNSPLGNVIRPGHFNGGRAANPYLRHSLRIVARKAGNDTETSGSRFCTDYTTPTLGFKTGPFGAIREPLPYVSHLSLRRRQRQSKTWGGSTLLSEYLSTSPTTFKL